MDGFSEAHVVGEASSEAEVCEEGEPVESVLLIRAEGTFEVGVFGGFGDFLG